MQAAVPSENERGYDAEHFKDMFVSISDSSSQGSDPDSEGTHP